LRMGKSVCLKKLWKAMISIVLTDQGMIEIAEIETLGTGAEEILKETEIEMMENITVVTEEGAKTCNKLKFGF